MGRADKVCPVEKWGDKAQATWLDEQNRRNDVKQCVYKYAAYCCLYNTGVGTAIFILLRVRHHFQSLNVFAQQFYLSTLR